MSITSEIKVYRDKGIYRKWRIDLLFLSSLTLDGIKVLIVLSEVGRFCF